jgi:hypothetical protein
LRNVTALFHVQNAPQRDDDLHRMSRCFIECLDLFVGKVFAGLTQ